MTLAHSPTPARRGTCPRCSASSPISTRCGALIAAWLVRLRPRDPRDGPATAVEPGEVIPPGDRVRVLSRDQRTDRLSVRVLRAAAAVELLHNVSLIVDDILDRSRYRRGELSLHCRYGFLPGPHDRGLHRVRSAAAGRQRPVQRPPHGRADATAGGGRMLPVARPAPADGRRGLAGDRRPPTRARCSRSAPDSAHATIGCSASGCCSGCSTTAATTSPTCAARRPSAAAARRTSSTAS